MSGVIAVRLKQRLDELGWESADLAARLGVSKVTVNRWLRGANEPRASQLLPIAIALEVTVAWLVGNDRITPSE